MTLKVPKQKELTLPVRLWKRALSFFVDLIIIDFLIITPFAARIESQLPKKDVFVFLLQNEAVVAQLVLIFAVIGVLALAYFTLFEYLLQQSPGKMLFNIRIEALTGNLSFFQALTRNFFLIPLFPFTILFILDFFIVLFKNKTLSEMLSKTQTVETYYE